ncbi:MAG: hypothetical protein IBJ00_02115 [Alphaproteobacteria bacterium]|nr:hypothetical protein [Alphaproteobacteria bacterium]
MAKVAIHQKLRLSLGMFISNIIPVLRHPGKTLFKSLELIGKVLTLSINRLSFHMRTMKKMSLIILFFCTLANSILASKPQENEPCENQTSPGRPNQVFSLQPSNNTVSSTSSGDNNPFTFGFNLGGSPILPSNASEATEAPFIFGASMHNKTEDFSLAKKEAASQRRARKARRNHSTSGNQRGLQKLETTDFSNNSTTTSLTLVTVDDAQKQAVRGVALATNWSSLATEVKLYILTFLKQSNNTMSESRNSAARNATENSKFLTYRLVSKEFDTLLQAVPCTLTLYHLNTTAPEYLDDLKNLFKFNINGLVLNSFKDNQFIFDNIRSQLPNLQMLDLRGSPELRVNMLYYVSKLLSLEDLSLEGPQINDEAIKYIKGLTNLKILTLRNTNICNKVFEELKSNRTLQAIDLSRAQKSGHQFLNQDLIHVHTFPFLTKLNLSGHPITDSALKHLSNLLSLKELLLFDTDITDQGLDNIGKLPLEVLDLSRTRITIDGFHQKLDCNMFSNLKILSLDQIPMSHIALSSIVKPLENLEKIYLRNTGIHIMQILQYYEDISGIKQKDLVGYNMVMLPKSSVKGEKEFFEEIQAVQNPKDVFMQKISLTYELLKAFYEQQITGVKIFM